MIKYLFLILFLICSSVVCGQNENNDNVGAGLVPAFANPPDISEKLRQHVYTLAADSLMGRKAGSEFAYKAADYIAAQWNEIGIAPLVGDFYFMPFVKYHNLVGIIEGNDPVLKYEYIVIGAHYDHLGVNTIKGETVIYNGADDNASGVAALIELGRNLKALQPSLRRSVVLIAFDAEESGLLGSNEFSAKPPFPVENIKLMMSIDMVGWYKASGYIKYYGTGTIKDGKRLLREEQLLPEGLNVKTRKFERSLFTATDTYGFAERGIPTLAVTTGTKSPYHKPEDMAHLIDYEGMALITEHLTNMVVAVSQDNSFKASGRVASKHNQNKKFVFGVSTNFGSNYHHYTAGALDGKSNNATGIGLNGQLNMKNFAFRLETYYEYVSAQYPKIEGGDITTHGITIPLNFVVQTNPTMISGLAFIAGPYYSYKLAGTQGNTQIVFKNVFNREEIGLNLGFELKLAYIRIGYTHRIALTNFSQIKNDDGAHIRNRASYATIGFTF